MNRQRGAVLLLFVALVVGPTEAYESRPLLVGTYDLPRMESIKSLTFPRIHLYDAKGELVPRERWPSELAEVNKAAGEAFCCVADKPAPAGWVGPPPDCKFVIYGEDINEHFAGLRDAQGKPISRAGLPKHEYLIVEYFAEWCAPCRPARRALEDFFASPDATGYTALVVDFTKLVDDK